MRKKREIERLRKGMGLGPQGTKGRASRLLKDNKDTAHDEEFFHCFVSYLDEAIKKLKEQGGIVNFD